MYKSIWVRLSIALAVTFLTGTAVVSAQQVQQTQVIVVVESVERQHGFERLDAALRGTRLECECDDQRSFRRRSVQRRDAEATRGWDYNHHERLLQERRRERENYRYSQGSDFGRRSWTNTNRGRFSGSKLRSLGARLLLELNF